MMARDTISDFVAYLGKRERLFRGHPDICTTGEEQLLAIYLQSFTENDEHDFVFPIPPGEAADKIYLAEGHWEDFQKLPQRIAQIAEGKVSYTWDRLIEKFNYYALRGEQHFVTTGGIRDAERVLRFMAAEPRWKRRYLARRILEMLKTTPAHLRRLGVLPPTRAGEPHYVFLLLPKHPSVSDEDYRLARRSFLESCCAVVRLEFPDAKDIIGIATESGEHHGSRSEDAIYFDARHWNADMENHANEAKEKLGILKKAKRFHEHAQEYPDAPGPSVKTKNPRNKQCPCGSGKKFKHCCLDSRE